jgi:hypothetical protein
MSTRDPYLPEPAALAALLARAGLATAAAGSSSATARSGRVRLALAAGALRPPAAARPAGAPPPRPLPTLVVEEGSLEDRLEAFRSWALDASGAERLYVADSDGLPLVGEASHEGQVAVAPALEQILATLRTHLQHDFEGTASFQLDEDQSLQLIWVVTCVGRLVVGAVGSQTIDERLRVSIRAALREVFSRQGEST